MKALIDADILLYEIGFSSQEGYGEMAQAASWDFVENLVQKKLHEITYLAESTEEPILYITNTRSVNKSINKRRKFAGEKPKEYVENFRVKVAKDKEYKGTRKSEKPLHYKNLQQYFLNNFNTVVNEEGLEADDAMCIEQYSRVKEGKFDTTICSRDKDLWQCPGWHISWEVGKQAAKGPILVDELGFLQHLNEGERDAKGRLKPAKIFGGGDLFFYYQMLTGDSVDNIGGLPGRGPVFGHNLLKDCKSVRQAYEYVAELYVKTYGDEWKVKFREQADLLWMIRELDEKGEKIRWRPPSKD